jgi:putative redox protein
MAVNIDIGYGGGLHCTAIHGPSGQELATDAPVDNGGKGETFSPTDLVATGLATCVATILALAAQRVHVDLAGLRVHVIKEMVSAPVRRIGALRTTVTFPQGIQLTPDLRARLEQAAQTCPVKQSLHPDIQVAIDFIYPA